MATRLPSEPTTVWSKQLIGIAGQRGYVPLWPSVLHGGSMRHYGIVVSNEGADKRDLFTVTFAMVETD